jgi:hypothetical protein
MSIQDILIAAARETLVALVRYLQSQGQDPAAVLNAHFDAADILAEAAERAKFGAPGA